MSVLLTMHETRGVLVLDISGRLTVSDHSFREAIGQYLKAGKRQFVLKMDGVSYLDSCGLGELVCVYTSVKNLGGTVQLLTPSEKVRELLILTRLDSVFEILEDARPFVMKAPSAGAKTA